MARLEWVQFDNVIFVNWWPEPEPPPPPRSPTTAHRVCGKPFTDWKTNARARRVKGLAIPHKNKARAIPRGLRKPR